MEDYREFTPEEEKWLKSFGRVMKKAPNTLFLFVGSGIVIYPKDENNQRYISKSGGVQDVPATYSPTTSIDYDGGDY